MSNEIKCIICILPVFIRSSHLFWFLIFAVHPIWKGPLDIPGGSRQSPIDIRVRDSVFHPNLAPISTQYDPNTCLHIWNNGYAFLVEYDDSTNKSGEMLLLNHSSVSVKKKKQEPINNLINLVMLTLFNGL